MRKLFFLGVSVCLSPCLCHSQSNTAQLPNGVVVHQAQGVEVASESGKGVKPQARTIQDWNLSECIDALPFLEMKLNEASPSDREYYLQERDLLVKRINELKSAN